MTEIPTASRLIVGDRDRNRCVRCGGRGYEWHHRRTRAVRDVHQHCACNGVLLCRTCHTWVHQHPAEARPLGLIVSKFNATPFAIPVVTVWGTRFHDCDGTITYEQEQPE